MYPQSISAFPSNGEAQEHIRQKMKPLPAHTATLLKACVTRLRICFALCLLLFAYQAIAAPVTVTFTANGNWTAPVGVTSVTVEAWGSGGGGGSAITANNTKGGGGGGGGYSKKINIPVTPGNVYAYTVGPAGAGGTTGGVAATAGGNTTFNATTVVANGGSPGGNSTGPGLGGAAGAGGAVGTGDVGSIFRGGNASAGGGTPGGAGGGGAGTGGAGGDASGNTAGTGTATGGGNGGAGLAAQAAGNPGSVRGGGGGGGYRTTANRAGGAGALGAVAITYTPATVIADGTNPGNATLAPGGAITPLDAFTLQASSGTDSVTALTVTLAAGTGAALSSIGIRSAANCTGTTYFANVATPGDSVNFSGGTAIPVTTTATPFYVCVTPKTHANMPVPPGSSYAVTGTVTAFTSTNPQSGSDGASATVTVDNLSPAGATATSGTAADARVTLNWTTSASADFNTAAGSVVYRWPTSAGAEVPVEGSTPTQGTTNGTAFVACVVTSAAASTPVSVTNGTGGGGGCNTTALVNGTAYAYKVFQKDLRGNYDTGTSIGTFTPIRTTTLADGANPGNATLAPGGAITPLDAFTLQTSGGTDNVTALTVTLAAGTGAALSSIGIRSAANCTGTTYFANVANPGDSVNFSGGTAIPATTTATNFYVCVTPKTHANMPVPPGLSYAVTGTVTAYTSTNAHAGADGASATVTVDNLSPAGATATSGTPANARVILNWTTSASADFNTTAGSVVYRWPTTAGAEVPLEGTTPTQGTTNGTAFVACVVTSAAPSTVVSVTNGTGGGGCNTTALVNGTAYAYKVFQKDLRGNYDTGVSIGTFTPNVIPTKLAYSQQPTNTVSGATISPAITVQIQDAAGTLVTSSTASVTLAIATNPGGGTLSGTVTVNAVAGVATFNNLSINAVGTGYTLAATSSGLTGATSNTFNITAGAANKLAFFQQPSDTTVTTAISPAVTVQIQDAAGNLVTTDTRTVTVAKNVCGGTLGGTTSVAAVGGVATFSNLTISLAGVGCTLTATSSPVLTPSTSGAFNITALPASNLAFSVQPSKAAPGVAISPAITVLIRDSANNPVPSSTAIVTLAIGANPGSGTLSGTTSVAAVAGVATFSNLAINNVGTGYTLTASSSGLTGATSSAFNITTATKLAFFQQPSNTGATYTISPAVTVQIQNASSGLVTTSTDTLTLAIGNNAGAGGAGVLSGNLSAAAVAGVATFSNLSINLPGTAYTLTANANTPGAGLTGDTSVAFNITSPVCFTDDFERASLLDGNWTRTKGVGTTLDAEIVGGRLRLTDSAVTRATAVHLNRLFPGFGNKVTAEFNYYAYDGNGADGLVLTLSDASVAPVAGAFGGSLGYAQKCQNGVSGCVNDCNVAGGCPGFTGGWIGVGLDEYGNYSNPTEGRIDGPGALADAITIRGSGSNQSGYNYHTRAAAPGGVDVAGATPGPGHRYRITVDHSDAIHAYTSVDRDSTTKDGTNYVNIVPVYDAKAIGTQAGVPTNWFFSFTASTGASTNIHEIDNLKVCTPNPQVVPVLDHVRIIHDGSALTCAPETITLKACANASCSALYTGSVLVNLSAPGATASLSNPVTISGGQVQLTLSKATTGTVTLGGSVTSPSVQTAVCYNGATSDDCSLVYSSNACTFDAVEVGLNPGGAIYTKLSGTAFSVDVLALTAGAINTAFNGAVTVDLVDQTGVASGSCGTTVLATPTNAPAWASGRRTYNFNYANAARDVRVRIVQTTPPVTACSSDNFAIRPTSFTVTSPNATNTASTGTPTFRAGTTVFELDAASLTGYTGSALLNNYRVSAHAGAVQSGSVNWPANTSPFAAAALATSWVSKGTQFTYSDVGNFQFLPWGVYDDGSFADVDRSKSECFTDGNKLGTNLDPVNPNVKDGNGKYGCYFGNTANSAFFGRFIPDHFAITAPALTAACPINTPFTYFGQDGFTTAFTLTAQNANNATTANYAGTWAKLNLATWANYGFSAATLPAGSLLAASATAPTGTWTAGSAAVSAKHQISRPTALSSPATITISALPADTDGITMASAFPVGLTLQRYGRLYLKDATVPALVNPQIDALLQYYDTTIPGGPWQNNVDDSSSCTSIAANTLQIGSIVKPGSSLLAFGTPPTGVAASQTSPGKWKITLTPTTRGDGRANILLNLGGAVGTTGCSTLTSPVGGAAPATSLAHLADNCGSGSYNKSSTATVTFGTKKSVLIYLREKH